MTNWNDFVESVKKDFQTGCYITLFITVGVLAGGVVASLLLIIADWIKRLMQ